MEWYKKVNPVKSAHSSLVLAFSTSARNRSWSVTTPRKRIPAGVL